MAPSKLHSSLCFSYFYRYNRKAYKAQEILGDRERAVTPVEALACSNLTGLEENLSTTKLYKLTTTSFRTGLRLFLSLPLTQSASNKGTGKKEIYDNTVVLLSLRLATTIIGHSFGDLATDRPSRQFEPRISFLSVSHYHNVILTCMHGTCSRRSSIML